MILGTAGHIDHGKTSLVKALTGVDTDRLKEEKERGITIELGFAELVLKDGRRFGVVDVPGHEAFVRAMVAGAAGMDVVLLVVAADEGVMPQTREHLAIVEMLGVPELVIAVTKCDMVDDDWLELVDQDIMALLEATRYAGAPIVHTSAVSGAGLDALLGAVARAGELARASAEDDLARLPLDRVFTIPGTGTVATGTLWSGRIRPGERVRVLPQDLEARVRGVQVHDRDVQVAEAGDRTAVALAGPGADRAVLQRGAVIVTSSAWSASRMLTVKARLLADADCTLRHNQRVRLHHGTAEVLARVALLASGDIAPGGSAWIQLRLEEPIAARARDRFVMRAYSPVATIGGGEIVEPDPPKRKTLDEETRARLERVLAGGAADALAAHVELQGWRGAPVAKLPVQVGFPPSVLDSALVELFRAGGLRAGTAVFAPWVRAEAEARVLAAVAAGHAADPLRAGVPLAAVRHALPCWGAPELADAVVAALIEAARLKAAEGGVSLPGHRPLPTPDQEVASERIRRILAEGGLGAPDVAELPDELRTRDDLWSLLRRLEGAGVLVPVADGLYLDRAALDRAAARIRAELGGRTGLGPAHFKEVLPVSRKRLLPLLHYFDGQGVTLRRGDVRDVPVEP